MIIIEALFTLTLAAVLLGIKYWIHTHPEKSVRSPSKAFQGRVQPRDIKGRYKEINSWYPRAEFGRVV